MSRSSLLFEISGKRVDNDIAGIIDRLSPMARNSLCTSSEKGKWQILDGDERCAEWYVAEIKRQPQCLVYQA